MGNMEMECDGQCLDDPKVAVAIGATGRKKLIIAGISLEVCAAFPAIRAARSGCSLRRA